MARFRSRIAAAIATLRGNQAIISSTVTPYESGMEQRKEPAQFRSLLNRYAKWVKVASSRNAAAVASVPCRWYRETRNGSEKASAFRGWSPDRKALTRRKAQWGPRAIKSLDYIGDDDNVEEIVDPMFPGNALFDKAWPGGSWFELLELAELHLSLTGNAYWAIIVGPSGWPTELWPLNPQDVTIVPSETNLVQEYIYGREQTNEKRYAPETILHFRRPNPKSNPYYGFGDLAACVTDADVSQMMSDFTMSVMQQGGAPSAVLTLPPSVTAAQATEIEQRMNQKFMGTQKAGRIWVLRASEADLKIMDSGSGKEKPYLQSEAQVRDVIANCFDMPVAMLTLDNAALATGKVAAPQWQLYGVRPRVKRIEDVLNESLVPMFRKALGDDSLFVGFDNCVDEDEDANADRGVKLYQGGVVTKNEARATAGLPPIADGSGDDFYQPAPSPSGFGEEQPKDEPPKNELPKPDEGEEKSLLTITNRLIDLLPSKNGHTVMASVAAEIETIHKPIIPKSFARFVWSSKWTRREVKDRRDHPPMTEIEAMTAALAEVFRDASAIAGVLAQHPGSIPEAFAAIALDARLMEAITPGIESMLTGGYNAGALDVKPKIELDPFNLASPDARRFLDTYRIRSVRTVMDTVEAQVRGVIQAGLEKGTTVDELTTEVGGVLDGYATYGSERIARTETARAYMHGRERAWKDSGVVAAKEWLLSSDPCPLCEAMAQQYNRVDLGRAFLPMGSSITDATGAVHRMDYAPVQGPPVHPGCRCSLGAVFKGE